jgi:hypothetical protein
VRHPALAVLAATLAFAAPAARSQTQADSGDACTEITDAATQEALERMQANDAYETQPDSVKSLSCFDNLFNMPGLNMITNILDPAAFLNSLTNQICNALKYSWDSTIGSAQCGLSLTGFNLGFSGLGGTGLMCPSLSFGGGGPPLASIGGGWNAGHSGFIVTSNAQLPSGYTASPADAASAEVF